MNDLLARYAECLFWFGRYTERTACLARILEVQTSFTRGKPADEADWGWILTLYDDGAGFAKLYDRADAASVVKYYVDDRRNPSSLISNIQSARENARTLRALISTDLWMQINAFYNRFQKLHSASFSTTQLSATCSVVKKECYAQLGVAMSTLHRDPAFRFFMLGVLIERADQMSRLLDVRFAQARQGGRADERQSDFSLWSILLRAATSHQAYLRVSQGRRDAESVARFFIFNPDLPRSIAFCSKEIDLMLNDLRSGFDLKAATPALIQMDAINQTLAIASKDEQLVQNLHDFNDQIQLEFAKLGDELAFGFFGLERPELAASQSTSDANQTQSQSQT